VKKPAHQWQTRRFVAVRRPDGPGPGWADDPRAEAFDVLQGDEVVGVVRFGLRRQTAPAALAGDPDVQHALRCWLAARGCFAVALQTEEGRPVQEGPFSVADLGDAPAAPAQRLVTLAPSNAELVDALGVFDRVVACEDSTDKPAAAAALPRLGPDLGPDLDRVAALHPDLVVSSLTVPGMERIVTGLRARGVPQVVTAPRTLADVLEDLRRVGAYLGRPSQAADVVATLQAEIAALRAAAPANPVRVYLEWWPRPMFSPGHDSYAHELIELAGGHNVFGDRPGASVQIEPEQLLAADPEVCFVSWCGVAEAKLDPARLIERPGLETLPAARAGRVHALDEALSGRPGPNVFEAARRMAAVLRALRDPAASTEHFG
jgi:iron complex transport system substrate-binding protein